MPVLDSHVFDMTRAIQLAVAPVFLLTAIGTLINALMGRLGRAVDRRRKLEELLSAFEGETRISMDRELEVLARRIKLVLWVASLGYAGYFFGNLPWVRANLSLIIVGIVAVSLIPLAVAAWKARGGAGRA